ncbi:MAG TPA: hypothetical protein DEO70_11275 [Bacteroidales bacterium]|nr:MAG: hypothetical protein A2X11_05495 [Bacteroidetes bacterium GWE2_42_24]OFY30484.1 MAG: hypothetical protein A2X09_16480 [Bacteroidetes bacterium GWF2_43_11]PKP22730.1 MAG: hypothetical protein CVU06_09230 [Bacteroidetes bacterium HGW-Bacteroidetes-22]HBZ67408.1 hypothetical protein [Bacteroidales bacterium]
MKRISIMLALALLVTIGFAQKKDRTSAYNYYRNGKYDKAQEYIEKTITHESTMNEAKTWAFRGDIYLQIALTDKPEYKSLSDNPLQIAFDSYKKALSLPDAKDLMPNIMTNMNVIAENYYNKGVVSYESGDYNASMTSFLKVADVKSEIGVVDTVALKNAVAAADLAKQPAEALKINQRLLDLKYSSASVYSSMANAYMATGDTSSAIAITAKGREIYPMDLGLLLSETNIFLFTGKAKEALNNLNVALEKDPTNTSILYALGTQYNELNNDAEAEKAYKKALEIKPDYFDAIYNLGALYVNQAAGLMAQANSIPPDKVKEYEAKKAEAFVSLDKALPYLERAHQMDPGDRNTMVTLKEIYARKSMLDKVKEIDAKLR